MDIVSATRELLLSKYPDATPPPPPPVVEEAPAAPPAEGEKPAKPAPKVAPKPPPRVNGLLTVDYARSGVHLDLQVESGEIPTAAALLDEQGFVLESITGVDWIKENQLEVLYDFSRTDGQLCRVLLRCRTPRDTPSVPTLSQRIQGANWHERETHDFFGIVFEGHPDLSPLLLPEDADFHPLRKDFTA